MNQFYLYLSSDNSLFIDNNPANFKTHLSIPLELSDDWYAALVELSFIKKFSTLPKKSPETAIFVAHDGGNVTGFRLEGGSYDTLEDLIQDFNNASKIESVEEMSDLLMQPGSFEWVVDIVSEEGSNVTKYDKNPVKLEIIDGYVNVRYTGGAENIYVSPTVRRILGFVDQQAFSKGSIGAKKPEIERDHDMLFVYSDLITNVQVSDTWAPLLRVVDVDRNIKKGERVTFIPSRPFYIKLESGRRSSIEIIIRSNFGDICKLSDHPTRVVLHLMK